MTRASLSVVAIAAALGGCGSCSDKSKTTDTTVPASDAEPAKPEVLPRCRFDGARATIEGDDVVVGDVASSPAGLLAGIVRRKDGAKVQSVLRASADLREVRVVDIGPSFGDDPPPTPRWKDGAGSRSPEVAWLVRKTIDAGTTRGMRELRFAPLEDAAVGAPIATVIQQADESTAFDVAWPLVAWDEDALIPEGKFLPDHGVVKVQKLPDGKPHTVSPDTSDADSPKIIRKKDGYWLAWIARKPEVADAGYRVEGAGDLRAWRWVEVVALDADGESRTPPIRVSPETGHAVAFDIVSADPELVLVVQDESAPTEGGGSRIVRYVVHGDGVTSQELVDGGVGHALADVVVGGDAGWIAWKDTQDRSLLAPASRAAGGLGRPTVETTLDDGRLLAAGPGSTLYVTSGRELRRLQCR